jgi:hypothetical protein
MLMLVVAGCSSPLEVSPTTSASGVSSPLLTVETRGGECPNGACGSVITIGRDGSVRQVRPTAKDLGTLPSAELEALSAEIERANFPLIESRPFTGDCPTAFDGQELIYTFHLPTGDEAIATCRVAVDQNHPLFLAVGAAIRSFTSEGPLNVSRLGGREYLRRT